MFIFIKHYKSELKHAVLLVAIGAVMCLQAGFTFLTAMSGFTEQSSLIVGNANFTIRPIESERGHLIADLAPEDLVERGVAAPLLPKPHRVHAVKERTLRHATLARHRPTSARNQRTMTRATYAVKKERPVPFKTVYIKTNNLAEEAPVRSPEAASDVHRVEKRSFFASAVPIVKKPYGWIKALGSKIF